MTRGNRNSRRSRRRKKVRVNYTRLMISLLIFLLMVFLLIKGVSAIGKAITGKNNNPKPTSTETKTDTTGNKTDSKETVDENSKTKETQDTPVVKPVDLTAAQRLEDYEYLKQILEKSHPFFKLNITDKKLDWQKLTESYQKKIAEAPNDAEFVKLLGTLTRQLADQQTNLLNPEFYNYLKVKYTEMSKAPWLEILNDDRVRARYKVMATEELDNMIGDDESSSSANRISCTTPVEGQLAVIKITDFVESKVSEDNAVIRSFLEKVKDYPRLVFDITGNKEGVNLYWIKNIVAPLISDEMVLTGRIAIKDDQFQNFSEDSLKNKNNYIKYGNQFPMNELPEDLQVPDTLKNDFLGYRRFDITVIPDNPIAFGGSINLLVDRQVYGSADTLAQFCKSTGFASIIGTVTKGYGMTGEIEPALVVLPNSGLVLRMPFTAGLNYDGTLTSQRGTLPDVEVTKAILDQQELMSYIK